ncbi:aconitase X catalytic domain-containing protein, partial [Candidatus Aerophobetes bacterium]|nr:aconitase X catalytic domain-containing protein [Candidatus Aerophobetes bacterium]
MRLTKYEQEMLEGDQGEAKKFAMEVLVRLGEIYGADRMIEIVSAQIMAHYGSLHDAGIELVEKFVKLGGKFCIPVTEDPASVSFRHWKQLGISEEYYNKQQRLANAIIKLGAQPVWTCTPYFVGNLPRFGQNVAWAESSAVSFANSVLGARTNRNPAGLNYCAALTGRMPNIGLYKEENRVGEVLIEIEVGELSNLDYNTLGFIIGKRVGNAIPVLRGIPSNVTIDNLKYLGAVAASSGCVALYHVLGITPEAV